MAERTPPTLPPAVGDLAIAYTKSFAFPRVKEQPRAGLYEDRAGWSWLVEPGGAIKRLGDDEARGAIGGHTTIHTDANGQATIAYPEGLPSMPTSIVVTVENQIVMFGILVITIRDVTIFAWDVFSNEYAKDRDIGVYWQATFS